MNRAAVRSAYADDDSEQDLSQHTSDDEFIDDAGDVAPSTGDEGDSTSSGGDEGMDAEELEELGPEESARAKRMRKKRVQLRSNLDESMEEEEDEDKENVPPPRRTTTPATRSQLEIRAAARERRKQKKLSANDDDDDESISVRDSIAAAAVDNVHRVSRLSMTPSMRKKLEKRCEIKLKQRTVRRRTMEDKQRFDGRRRAAGEEPKVAPLQVLPATAPILPPSSPLDWVRRRGFSLKIHDLGNGLTLGVKTKTFPSGKKMTGLCYARAGDDGRVYDFFINLDQARLAAEAQTLICSGKEA